MTENDTSQNASSMEARRNQLVEEVLQSVLAHLNQVGERSSPESAVADEVLKQIRQNQRSQQKLLQEIERKVGCLYTYMIVSIVLAILGFILGILSGF